MIVMAAGYKLYFAPYCRLLKRKLLFQPLIHQDSIHTSVRLWHGALSGKVLPLRCFAI